MVDFGGGGSELGEWVSVPGIVDELIASYEADIAEAERPIKSDVPRNPNTSGLRRSVERLRAGEDYTIAIERVNRATGNNDMRQPHTIFDVSWRQLMEEIRGVVVRAGDLVRLVHPGEAWQYVPGGPVQCPRDQLCIHY